MARRHMHDAACSASPHGGLVAAGEPNVLQLWSARTQSHAVRGFMVTDFERLPTWRERAVRAMP